jgi:hypothetical protein
LLVVASAVVCSNVPPVEAVYQRKVPLAPDDADSVTVPVPQRAADTPVGVLEALMIVAVTACRGVTQPLSNDT